MSLSALIRVRGVETSRQFPEGHPLAGRWESVDLSEEFAALVGAADAQHTVIEAEWHSHKANCACALCAAKVAYSVAHAALMAKITASP